MLIVQIEVVLAGLDPAIHVLTPGIGEPGNRVDARVKPAHDDIRLLAVETRQPTPLPQTALPRAAKGSG